MVRICCILPLPCFLLSTRVVQFTIFVCRSYPSSTWLRMLSTVTCSKWEAMKALATPCRNFNQAAMLTSRHRLAALALSNQGSRYRLAALALALSNQGAMSTSQPTLSSLGMVKCHTRRGLPRRPALLPLALRLILKSRAHHRRRSLQKTQQGANKSISSRLSSDSVIWFVDICSLHVLQSPTHASENDSCVCRSPEEYQADDRQQQQECKEMHLNCSRLQWTYKSHPKSEDCWSVLMLSFLNLFFTSHRYAKHVSFDNRFTFYQKLRPEHSGDHGDCEDTMMDDDTDHLSVSWCYKPWTIPRQSAGTWVISWGNLADLIPHIHLKSLVVN